MTNWDKQKHAEYLRDRFEECEICGAPRGEYVTRQQVNSLHWSMDLDLYFANRHAWTAPKKVRLRLADGLCTACQKAKADDLDGVA